MLEVRGDARVLLDNVGEGLDGVIFWMGDGIIWFKNGFWVLLQVLLIEGLIKSVLYWEDVCCYC